MDGYASVETKVVMDPQPMDDLRIVLFGKTQVGKSTLGDIIVGNTNTSETSSTDRTQKSHGTVEGQKVVVVDTPGLFKRGKDEDELVKEIKRSVDLASPGPHVFLLVLRFGRITSEELEVLEAFERTFGRRASAYTTVVFTHTNEVVECEALIQGAMSQNKHIRELIERCQWRYFAFNINDVSTAQVTELLKKITPMGKDYFYTPEMLQEAAKPEEQEEKPKTEETTGRRAFLERTGLVGVIVGSVGGYLLGGGELTSTSGALLGALGGSVLSMGTTALVLKIKMLTDKCCKK